MRIVFVTTLQVSCSYCTYLWLRYIRGKLLINVYRSYFSGSVSRFVVKMFKVIVSALCLLLVHKSLQEGLADCASGKCCIPNVGSFDGNGQLISDPNGICQQYACFDGGYSIYQCPQYGEKCSTVPGIPGALFPDCCLQLDAKADQTGCTAVA